MYTDMFKKTMQSVIINYYPGILKLRSCDCLSFLPFSALFIVSCYICHFLYVFLPNIFLRFYFWPNVFFLFLAATFFFLFFFGPFSVFPKIAHALPQRNNGPSLKYCVKTACEREHRAICMGLIPNT